MKNVLIIIFILFLVSCPIYYSSDNPEVSEIPQNMNNINTEYDDYNSMAPPPDDVSFYFIYSTNRYSRGGVYRVGEGHIELRLKKEKSLTSSEKKKVVITDRYIEQYDFPCKATSGGDILGPVMFPQSLPYEFVHNYDEEIPYPDYSDEEDYFYADYPDIFSKHMVYFYTSETTRGDFDIFYCTQEDPTPRSVGFNTVYNEKYIYFDDFGHLLFSSDKEGKLNIYEISLQNEAKYYGGSATSPMDLYFWLKNYSKELRPEIISSISTLDADDTCPYVLYDTMVFASNRKRGEGGYDLYYTTYDESSKSWSKPRHFPYPINTKADEFRPSVYWIYGYKNYLMFFSSNRAGGSGGYDLYYVGVNFDNH